MISHDVLSNYHSINVYLLRGWKHLLKQILKLQKALLKRDLEIKSLKKNQRPDYILAQMR